MRLLAALAVLATLPAFAQQPRAPKTEVTFVEGDLIEGTDRRPDVELIDAAKAPKHSSLIKVREDFRREALSSANQL